jgi:hypothetical protein
LRFSPIDKRRRVRLFGQPHAAEAYALRDYLHRSVAAFDWLPDGRRLFAPSLHEVANSLGWCDQQLT